MVRKNTASHWCMLNTALIVLFIVLFLAYDKWLKPKERFWFVSYEWVRQNDKGAGRTCIEAKDKALDFTFTENAIQKKNKFDTVIINNLIPINKKTYSSCIGE
jgi:hypothetical protein